MVIRPDALFTVIAGGVTGQHIEVIEQVVAAQLLKTLEERGSPIGAIHFVGVVVKGPDTVVLFGKNAGKSLEITFYCTGIEMIQDPTFSAWRGAFYFLPGRQLVQGIKCTIRPV